MPTSPSLRQSLTRPVPTALRQPQSARAGAGRRARAGSTLTLTILALGSIAALGAACIGGAIAQNARAGAPLRAQQERVARVSAALGIDSTLIEAGRGVYMTTCTACHGPQGQALPGLGKDLAHSEFVRGLNDGGLAQFLKIGRTTWDPMNTTGVEMPGKGGNPALTDDNLREVVAYLRFLQASAATGQR